MELLSLILVISQLFFTIVAGMYFYLSMRNQHTMKTPEHIEYKKDSERLAKKRAISLTRPLSERTRPTELSEIIGQPNGIKALKAALCGKNPQHILIYGPPGVGKTAAARLILELAKKDKLSPFRSDAPFIEIDATTLRFDERNIADPLMGSVHDPIYQGSGLLGNAGIPQPKEGAVSQAHGGVLFIDEIGELHSVQMNKLLKVLEDRKVFFTSSYYNPDSKLVPNYIKDIFENGLPADFRLIGATTRSPEEIPPALRSRCTEIYFNSLSPQDIELIAKNACHNLNTDYNEEIIATTAKYCSNGRTAVNIIQSAYSYSCIAKHSEITIEDMDNVISSGRLTPIYSNKIPQTPAIGYVNGLAVAGGDEGILLSIEATAERAEKDNGSLTITGIVEEESIKSRTGSMKRKSTALASVKNALTVLKKHYCIDPNAYNIHINFPGGMPIDGPSAGIAIFTALYSALFSIPVDNTIAMTGEIGLNLNVLPVGGVRQKAEAALKAGAKAVIIPADNMQPNLKALGIKILPVKSLNEAIELIFSTALFNPTDSLDNSLDNAM